MNQSQTLAQKQPAAPTQRPGPVPLDSKDLQRVAGGNSLPRGGGWK